MKRFDTMLEAAQFAATLCQGWSFAYSDDTYDKESLLVMAETHDQENPADEDSFYVVSLGGSIGYCEDGEAIDWLFMSGSGAGENLPAAYQAGPRVKFCPKCGNSIVPGALFCGKCGHKL